MHSEHKYKLWNTINRTAVCYCPSMKTTPTQSATKCHRVVPSPCWCAAAEWTRQIRCAKLGECTLLEDGPETLRRRCRLPSPSFAVLTSRARRSCSKLTRPGVSPPKSTIGTPCCLRHHRPSFLALSRSFDAACTRDGRDESGLTCGGASASRSVYFHRAHWKLPSPYTGATCA